MSAQCGPRNKIFLITGGASGLGALYTEWFLKEGAKSVAILDVDVEKGQALAAKLNKPYPEKVTFYKCDVSDEIEIIDAFNEIVKQFKQVDVIINNAGVMVDSPEMWRKSSDVNWQGLVSLTLKGVKHMRKDKGGAGGTIINASSTGALIRVPFLPIYCGSKAAVLHFSQSLSMDPFYEQTGVRILIFCLAATKTSMIENVNIKTWDEDLGITFKKFIDSKYDLQRPESAADAVVKMFKEGANGSIWLAKDDKPAEDITSIVDSAYKTFEAKIM